MVGSSPAMTVISFLCLICDCPAPRPVSLNLPYPEQTPEVCMLPPPNEMSVPDNSPAATAAPLSGPCMPGRIEPLSDICAPWIPDSTQAATSLTQGGVARVVPSTVPHVSSRRPVSSIRLDPFGPAQA